MINKNVKNLIKAFALVFIFIGSHSAFADDNWDAPIPTGIINPCQDMYLVNDPTDAQGVCVDIPVAFHHQVKVLFNLDTPVMGGPNPIGLRHMVMLGAALRHQIEIGNLDSDDISVIGIFHGTSMTAAHWPFTDSPVAGWIKKILAYNNPTDANGNTVPVVHMQLEVCGVTLDGMMQSGATLNDGSGTLISKQTILPGIYVNQGAIGRLIYLQQHGYAYIQEGFIDGAQ